MQLVGPLALASLLWCDFTEADGLANVLALWLLASLV